jgi:hypothetical protein
VNKWPILGIIMILVGLGILILLASVIVGIIIFLLEVLAIFIGLILILGGIAAITFGGRWMRMKWGETPATT